MKTSIIPIFFCLLVLCITGCDSNRAYRTYDNPYDPARVGYNSPTNFIEYQTNYDLGFVEIDDQGWFYDRRQLEAVTNMVSRDAGIGQATNTAGAIILLFVHGWENNADYDNTNVGMLRTELGQIREQESHLPNHTPRKVVGVYLGWRGESLKIPYLQDLTFWTRKSAAYKVGGYGAATELLVDLEHLQQESNSALPTNAPRTELIIVGHSFGGQVVYSALSQIMAEHFVNTFAFGKEPILKPLGDQVILLNPAFEASRYFDLYQMATNIDQYPTNQRPVLSIFTSKTDLATGWAFPVGRFFDTLFERNVSCYQKSATLKTVGWFQPFVSYDLACTNPVSSRNIKAPGFNVLVKKAGWFASKSEVHVSWQDAITNIEAQRATYISNIETQRAKYHANNSKRVEYKFSQTVLTLRPGRSENPFPIVSVNKEVMDGHGDITNPVLIRFLADYIAFCQTDPQKGQ